MKKLLIPLFFAFFALGLFVFKKDTKAQSYWACGGIIKCCTPVCYCPGYSQDNSDCKSPTDKCGPFNSVSCNCTYNTGCVDVSCGGGACGGSCWGGRSEMWRTCNLCICQNWVNRGGCGDGGCNANSIPQERNCSPNNCQSETRCAYSPSCSNPPTPPPPSTTCTVDLTPNTATIPLGGSTTFTASATTVPPTADIERVRFPTGNTAIASRSPSSDTTVVYQTQVTGVSAGSTTITARVVIGGVVLCTDTSTVTVTDTAAWWQAKDYTLLRRGSISSSIPGTCSGTCVPSLGLDGEGGFPGVAVYSGSIDTGSGNVSSKGWAANTALSIRKTYDYDFFERQIPDSITFNEITSTTIDGTALSSGGVETDGYYWYHFDGSLGDLTINSNVNLGDRKVVLMVDGANLTINRRIFMNDGTGFFAAFVGKNSSGQKGDIQVAGSLSHPSQPELEGLFHADSSFLTGTLGAGSDTQLHVNGMISTETNIVQERDLTNNSLTPAFLLEYAPELTLLMPKELMTKSYKWEEVAP